MGGGLVGYLIGAIFLGLVFKKAGEPLWKAFVPFVNAYTHVKLAGFNGWLFLLLIIPVVNVVFLIIVSLRIGKAFGKGGVFSFFLLFLFSLIGYIVLAFDDSRYDRSQLPA
ncbi:hypothetical protein C8046_12865 [Serinibacter arcticus]|uniref:Signal peptidase I n=1 Tax=Serinibacter arcticus TaxID=1655435 RepID=A0A2U2A005_9MICO|nr:hypothetical protein C8046_12865 [Serinibacter arcticus]